MDGQVFQKAIDYPDVEVAFYDLSDSRHPVQEARRIALSIQRTPMPFGWPAVQICAVSDMARRVLLVRVLPPHDHRRYRNYALSPIGLQLSTRQLFLAHPFLLPSSARCRTWFDCESEYEASTDYQEDQAYWTQNLPPESGPNDRSPGTAGEGDPDRPSAPVRLDPAVLRRVQELSQTWNVPRSSVITAACALLVRGWCTEGTEVVLDFPVSRRVRPGVEDASRDGFRGVAAGVEGFAGFYGRQILRACRHANTGSVAASAVSGARP